MPCWLSAARLLPICLGSLFVDCAAVGSSFNPSESGVLWWRRPASSPFLPLPRVHSAQWLPCEVGWGICDVYISTRGCDHYSGSAGVHTRAPVLFSPCAPGSRPHAWPRGPSAAVRIGMERIRGILQRRWRAAWCVQRHYLLLWFWFLRHTGISALLKPDPPSLTEGILQLMVASSSAVFSGLLSLFLPLTTLHRFSLGFRAGLQRDTRILKPGLGTFSSVARNQILESASPGGQQMEAWSAFKASGRRRWPQSW